MKVLPAIYHRKMCISTASIPAALNYLSTLHLEEEGDPNEIILEPTFLVSYEGYKLTQSIV